MNKSYVILAVVIAVVVVSASVYGAYTLLTSEDPASSPSPSATSTPTSTSSSSPTPSATSSPTSEPTITPSTEPTTTPTVTPTPTTQPTSVILTDYYGKPVNVSLPVERIAVLNGGLAEVICALDGEDKIVATAGNMVYPPVVLTKYSLGTTAKTVSIEALLSVEPDIVIVDQSFPNDTIAQIEAAGVPVYVDNAGYTERLHSIVTNFGLLLNNSDKAEQILETEDYYTNLVQQRITNANLTLDTMTTAYLERVSGDTQWICRTNGTQQDEILVFCGGINIAGDAVISKYISPEVVGEANPDIIIVAMAGYRMGFNLTDYQEVYDEVTSRLVLQETNAVKNGNVYIYYYYMTHGVQHVIGELYYAQWLYPDLFADIDVEALHAQLTEEYFGISLIGTWVYSGTGA